MNYNYDLQTGKREHFDRIISPVSSPAFFQERVEKSCENSFFKDKILNKILGNLSSEIRQNLSPHLEKINLEKGQTVHNAGDELGSIYLPETAVISEFQILPDGRTAGLSIIGNEGMFGVSSLLGSLTSNNWAQTLIAGTAFKIDIKCLRKHFDYCQFVKKNIFEYLNFYLTQISQKAVCNNHHQVSERLCVWILTLADRSQNQNQPLSLTQEQLAFFLGAQRPSVTAVTQNLREKGLIDYKRGKISILNRERLESAACSCYETAKFTTA